MKNRSISMIPPILLVVVALLSSALACEFFMGEQDDWPTPSPPVPTSTVEEPIPTLVAPTSVALLTPPPLIPGPGILLPPASHIYHAAFPGGLQDWGEEDDIFLEDLRSYEEHAGKTVAWVYFSHNWFRDRKFPLATATWIRQAGSVPYIRLMLRSDAEQNHAEPTFTLERIIEGEFDADLSAWGQAARDFGAPLLVEYGTEVNGEWFSWNGVWNGAGETEDYGDPGEADGPERFRDAYRHIIQTIEAAGADHITWVFHVDDSDIPEEEWNRFENYYPGDEWIDWVGVSVYGAGDPLDDECTPFRESMDNVYPRLAALASGKPIVVLEFGVSDNNPYCDQAEWAREALSDLLAFRWSGVIGFSWWNENWQNDDDPSHDTHMRIQDNPELAEAFQELVGENPAVLGQITLP